jgi:putative transposase
MAMKTLQDSVRLRVNQLFRDESNGDLYRVVYADIVSDVVLCRIYGSRLETVHVPRSEFLRRTLPDCSDAERFVEVEDDPFDSFRQINCVTAGHVEKSAENWRRIKGLVEDLDRLRKTLVPGPGRKRILGEHADAQKVTIQLIRRLHRQYLQRGMKPSAVSSGLFRCGRTEQSDGFRPDETGRATFVTRDYKKRPGRKPAGKGEYARPSELLNRLFAQYVDIYLTSKEGPWQVDVPDELMARIRSQIPGAKFAAHRRRRKPVAEEEGGRGQRRWPHGSRKRQGKRRRRTMRDMVDHLNYVCRSTREVRDQSGQLIELELAPFEEVTVRQFQHYYLTRVPPEVRKRRAMGDRAYSLTGRPKVGHALQHCPGPGAYFAIDATIADIYVVLRFDRTVVVGRPTIYLAMDLWSRMIVGVHVTLDPPSFEGVALVLESLVTPKTEICSRFGFAIGVDDWPCDGFPFIGFMTDHGSDFEKADAWRAVNQRLHVAISNVRVGDPTMRAMIERRWGIIQFQYTRSSFGVVEADALTRGAPHYPWDACETINEFTKKLLRAVLIYHQTPIGHEGAEFAMTFRNEADTPINRWKWGMANLTGSLHKHSIDEVRMATWPHDLAKPTDRGLLWKGTYYTSPYIESKLIHCWGKDAHKKIPIQFNPDDMSQIMLPGQDYSEYAQQAETNRQPPGDCDLMEWNLYREWNRRNAKEQHRAQQPQRIMAAVNNAKESHDARCEQRDALKRSGQAHPDTSNIRAARAHEMGVAKLAGQYGVFARRRTVTSGSAEGVATSTPEAGHSGDSDCDDVANRLKRKAMELLR